jgi:hypothetical protein
VPVLAILLLLVLMLALVQVLVAALVLLLDVVLVLASTCIFYHIPMIANNSRLPKQPTPSRNITPGKFRLGP